MFINYKHACYSVSETSRQSEKNSSPVAVLYPFGGSFIVARFPEGIAARLQKLIIAVMWHCCEDYVWCDDDDGDEDADDVKVLSFFSKLWKKNNETKLNVVSVVASRVGREHYSPRMAPFSLQPASQPGSPLTAVCRCVHEFGSNERWCLQKNEKKKKTMIWSEKLRENENIIIIIKWCGGYEASGWLVVTALSLVPLNWLRVVCTYCDNALSLSVLSSLRAKYCLMIEVSKCSKCRW